MGQLGGKRGGQSEGQETFAQKAVPDRDEGSADALEDKMTIKVINSVIVILGKGFDPTRLNIDYLRLKKLIPEEWNPTGIPIVSPVVSAINFENGTSLLAQQDRLQVGRSGSDFDPMSTEIERIALGYVEDNKTYQYISVGLNFQGAYPNSDSNAFLVERFSLPAQKIADLTLEKTEALFFSSERKGARLNFSIKAGKLLPKDKPEQPVALIDMNYDCQLGTAGTHGDAMAAIKRFEEAWADYRNIVSKILGG